MPLGWTGEQQAGVKRWWQFATFFCALGVALSIFLIASGNARGWGVLAFFVLLWGGGAYALKAMKRSRP
ncbi:hypothetical protein AQJ84_26820 [Streptomyces resistomycificus]|uniref:Uncharacterized protein n=1 Tax=Streptomyces resistomycificus TaxID=67356 RepID=A0A0L8KZT7_9ACTN|nr:hypothetical protein ADK37_30700 [Streptomyces resistomycificus]KUN94302.1 hypothetical protein AQJ84_26820 [Streptomyces resistomycificus]